MAQQIPNGDFESWDSLSIYDVYPENWLSLVINTFCVPVNQRAEKSGESRSGQWAAKLESKVCTDELGGLRLEEGLLYTGVFGWDPATWATPCGERPNQLRFYYKFHPEGSDSAYVLVLLFRYDTVKNEISDTIAFASGYIFEEKTDYTPFLLPLNYFSAETPEYVHVLFSTSKTLTEGFGNTPPYMYAYPGTTLWIDDVSLYGGTVDLKEPPALSPSGIRISPCPAKSNIMLEWPAAEPVWPRSFTLLNQTGKVCRRFEGGAQVLQIAGLPPGMYYLRIELETGIVLKKIIISE